MYKTFSAADWAKQLGLPSSYKVDGFIVFGTFKQHPYQDVKESLERLGYQATYGNAEHEFLKPIIEIKVKSKNYWFVTAYGGALLTTLWLTPLLRIIGQQKMRV